jgi:hypothetical protein
MFRQGDVLIIEVPAIPAGYCSRQDSKTILAYGEVSGHHHRFEHGKVTAFYKEGDDLTIAGGTALRGSRTDVEFISVPKGGAELIHEEHDTIPVGEGCYRIVRQREFSVLDGIRRVAD